MSRLSVDHRVFYVEEPIFRDVEAPGYTTHADPNSEVTVITPFLANGLDHRQVTDQQRLLLDTLIAAYGIKMPVLWYYTPMALPFTDHLSPICRVYDCMDELSAFKYAPAALKANEATLFQLADVVFTGGRSLYVAKRNKHHNIHAFPSSIDKTHFIRARTIEGDPPDQHCIPRPRFGFYGVLDERLDIELLSRVAEQRPDWHFIMIGPVVKIDPDSLPRRANIHYLGRKEYKELPSYLSGWDIAIMPFALNESTRFISPTKTPEYLAGGKPVISTSIRDVIEPYGARGLVSIADTPEQFLDAAEQILNTDDNERWLRKVDGFLAGQSWERTVDGMQQLIRSCIKKKMTITGRKLNINV